MISFTASAVTLTPLGVGLATACLFLIGFFVGIAFCDSVPEGDDE